MVRDLMPFGRRARTHSEAQIGAIARAIDRFGFNTPIVLDERGLVLIGWGKTLAARMLGLETVPSISVAHLSDDEKRAYILADNKLALMAGWDEELLKIEFEELIAAGFDPTITGFDADELNALLLPNAGRTDPEDVPDVPSNPVSQLGDLWILGRHRLICGSSTSAEDVALVLGSAKPHLMVTDPPYGVQYDPAWRTKAGVSSDNAAHGKVKNDDRTDWLEAWALFPGHVAYVWHSGLHCAAVHNSLLNRSMRVRSQIIWVKSRPVISRGHYHWQHEPAFYAVVEGSDDRFESDHSVCAYGVAEGATAEWRGDRKQSTVWFIDHLKNDTGHGTQKPVDCMRRPMLNNSKAGDHVYEPFMGSGTSIIAAEMSGRCSLGIELDPAYVDVAVRRWQAFTGLDARHGAADGPTFEAIALQRAA